MSRLILPALLTLALLGCTGDTLTDIGPAYETSAANVDAGLAKSDNACWGQASAVFAQTGEMGQHSSAQATPRVGLRNLARALAEAGIIEDDTMQALGAFVVAELGLSVDACL